jgi:hypothetical protein
MKNVQVQCHIITSIHTSKSKPYMERAQRRFTLLYMRCVETVQKITAASWWAHHFCEGWTSNKDDPRSIRPLKSNEWHISDYCQ